MGEDRNHKTGQSQPDRFKEAARELGCEDSEETFDEALKKVARHTPRDEKAKPADKARGSKHGKR